MNILAGILNDPLTFGLIIGGIILVAVVVILYVLLFRKKLHAGVEKAKVKRAKKAEEYEKATNMASDLFAAKEKEEERDTSLSDTEIGSIIKISKNKLVASEKKESKAKEEKKPKDTLKQKTKKSEKKDDDDGSVFNPMGQFSSKMK